MFHAIDCEYKYFYEIWFNLIKINSLTDKL